MADAAYAELYAESRRDGNAAGRSAGAESGRTVSAHFMISTRLPQSIFPAHYADHYKPNQTPIDYLFAFENRNAN
ncbi:hypothetical protein [Burkholderia ambifaria]|jgi:hypothetical protein|uniref:hypothetical protein n=1 Tax=Burkholderia ambifaria TaxID=152480 RepID=UPI001B98E489|nr:hypothetical protein [Burkholderia ambifaria]MBR8225277.1 hypothetical protein [Burkholderia ambifaria]